MPDDTPRPAPLPRLANQTAVHASAEEVACDFSFAGAPALGDPGSGASERIVFTWPAAKRLLLTLQQAVVQYEKDWGPIDPNPVRRPPSPANGNA